MSAVTNDQAKMTFGTFWKIDEAATPKEVDYIFRKGGLKVSVDINDVNNEDEEVQDKCIAMAQIKLHGTEFYVLMK